MAVNNLSSEERVQVIQSQIQEADRIYHTSDIDTEFWKKFYLGENQWDGMKPEGELKITVPITSAMLDQHVFLFTNKAPKINFLSPSASPVDRVKAQIAENINRIAFYDSEWPKLFQEAHMSVAQLGSVNLRPFWDVLDKKRSTKGSAKIMYLSPSYTRIIHGNGFKFHPTAFVFWERLSPEEVTHRYEITDVYPDVNFSWIKTLNIGIAEDSKVTVFTYIDDQSYSVIIGNKEVEYGEHGYGFVPIRQVIQIPLPDNVTSVPLLYSVDGLQKQLNLLLSAAMELALDMAYPPILEYGNALGTQKVDKWRRRKIKVRRSDKGEALTYLTPQHNPAVLIEQIKQVIDLCYLVTQMPPAALGVISTQITSGFQAQVFQQPASVKQASWGVQWTSALQDISSKIIQLVRKHNPEALKVDLGDGNIVDLDGIENYEITVDYGQSTPVDYARDTQMAILRLQNNLISTYQALEKLGDDNPFDTMEIIKQESRDVELRPEKALRVAQAQQILQQFAQQTAQSVGEMGGQIQTQGGQELPQELQNFANAQNQNNQTLEAPDQGGERSYPGGGENRLAGPSLGAGEQPLPNLPA